MSRYRAIEGFGDKRPLDLAEDLKSEAKGVASDPIYDDSSYTSIQLNNTAKNLIDTHEFKNGTPLQKAEYVAAHQAAITTLTNMAIYANFKCLGSSILFAQLGAPYYEDIKKGGKSSTFRLEQGPNSGQLWISVPVSSRTESYIAMYSLTDNAPLNECMLAGGSTSCRFLLLNLPVTTRLYIRWATLTSAGIGTWSESYPFPVN